MGLSLFTFENHQWNIGFISWTFVSLSLVEITFNNIFHNDNTYRDRGYYMAAWRYGDIFTCSSESSPGVSLVFINIIKQFQHYCCIDDVT